MLEFAQLALEFGSDAKAGCKCVGCVYVRRELKSSDFKGVSGTCKLCNLFVNGG